MHPTPPQKHNLDETVPRSHPPSSGDSAEGPHPLLLLDDEGTIQYASNRARGLLDAQSSTLTGQSFLYRVHPRTVKRVLHDLTEMAVHDMQRATWLLRLQTELGPWQWFKVAARNRFEHPDQPGVVLRLSERGGGSGRTSAS